jgi:NTP pyrophosphatase (non-canonical NTP hydrolase)
MNLSDYQKFARACMDPERDLQAQPAIRAWGVLDEAVEVYELVRLAMATHAEPASTRVIEEVGDTFWELANLCSEFQLELAQLASRALGVAGDDRATPESHASPWLGIERFAYLLLLKSGSASGYLKKVLDQRHPLDREQLQERLAEILYGIACLGTCFGADLEAIAQVNVDKLLLRYRQGQFTREESIGRVDTREG